MFGCETFAIEPGQAVAAVLHLLADHAAAGLFGRRETACLERLDQRRLAGPRPAGQNEETVVAKHRRTPLDIMKITERRRWTLRSLQW